MIRRGIISSVEGDKVRVIVSGSDNRVTCLLQVADSARLKIGGDGTVYPVDIAPGMPVVFAEFTNMTGVVLARMEE